MIRHLCRNQGDLFQLPDLYAQVARTSGGRFGGGSGSADARDRTAEAAASIAADTNATIATSGPGQGHTTIGSYKKVNTGARAGRLATESTQPSASGRRGIDSPWLHVGAVVYVERDGCRRDCRVVVERQPSAVKLWSPELGGVLGATAWVGDGPAADSFRLDGEQHRCRIFAASTGWDLLIPNTWDVADT